MSGGFLDTLRGAYSGLRRSVIDSETGRALVTSEPTGEVVQRSTLLPFGRDDGGRLVPAVPGLAMQAVEAATYPGQVYRGEASIFDPQTGHVSDEAVGKGLDLAGLTMTGSLPFKAPAGALRTFGGGEADDLFASLESALAQGAKNIEPPPAGPTRVDPGAKSWDLFHGSQAGEDFRRFDPNRGPAHSESGALFLAPDGDAASMYANGSGAGAQAGPRVFRTTVEPGRTKVFDLRDLAEDPAFRDRARRVYLDELSAKESSAGLRQSDEIRNTYEQNLLDNLQRDREIAAQLAEMGLPPGERTGVSFGYGHIGAALQKAREEGLDTAVIRGLAEHGGQDQVAVLTPGRVRSRYSGDLLYSTAPAALAGGAAAVALTGGEAKATERAKMSDPFDDLIAANPRPKAAVAAPSDPFEALVAANPAPSPVQDAPAAGIAGDGPAAVGRGIINGIPIAGPYLTAGLDRAVAGVRSLKNDTRYSDELKAVQAFGEATAKENPKATVGGEVLGGVVGTAPAIAAAPGLFGAGAASLPMRTGASLASGGVIGAADTAVRTGGDGEKTAWGAGTGAALGAISPAAGNLAGRGIRSLGELVAGRAAPVPGLNASAAGKLADDLRNAGGPDPVRARLAELGPDAMLLDASPSFEGRAQGLAVLPDTRETVVRPLAERARGTNARLARDIDANVGPATNPATFNRTLDSEYERVVPPLYARAFAEPVEVNTRNTLGMIDSLAAREKGGAATGLARARELLMTDGPLDAAGIPTRVPDTNPEALHNAKEALDAMIATVQAQAGGSARNSELRALSLARRSLNGVLEEQVPGYGFANRSAQRFFQQREAFGRGQTLLNGGREAVRPGQLAEETAEMVPEVAQAQRDGLRAEVDRLVGTTLNDRVALQKAVQGEGDWNRARMNTVFGEEPTAGLVGAVERERAFDASNQRIVNNSMTELRKRAADDLAPRSLDPGSGEVGTVIAGATGGPAGIAAAQGVKGLKATANAMGREADIERNRQIAQAVTMIPGEALDALIAALGVRAQGSANAQNAGEAIELLTQALLQSQGERSRRIVPSGLRGQ